MSVIRNGSLIMPVVIVLLLEMTGMRAYSNAESPEGPPKLSEDGARPLDYQALSLEDCLALARKHNPVLTGAREKIQELLADYRTAKSRYFPRLVLASYYERANPDRLSPAGALTTPLLFREAAWLGVSGKQVLYDGRRTHYSALAAKTGAESQRQEVLRTADEIAFAVTEAFYGLVEAKENLTVALEALRERQDFAAIAEAFFRAGKVTRLDSFRAKSQVSEAEQAKTEAENAARLASEILARSMGLREEAALDIAGGLPSELTPPSDFGSLWREALKTNPEIKKLDLEIAQSKNQVKAARGAYLPEISLQGGVGVRHYDMAGTKGEWLGGVFVEFPFFEGGLTRAQVAKATSQLLQLVERKRDRVDSIKSDLTAAWLDQGNAYQGVMTARQTMLTNEEAYASAQALYRSGKAVGLDVLQAQVDVTRSRFDSIRYAVVYQIARARIKQITGSGLSDSFQPANKGRQGQ